jgi:DNA-binding NtrC family response regulator
LACPSLKEYQNAYICRTYHLAGGNMSKTARVLGVAENTVRKTIRQLA